MSDACRVAPQRHELWLEVAKALMAQKRAQELEPLLRTATALHPDNAALLQLHADLCLRSKRYVQAVPLYARLRALQPKDPATLLHYGFCLEHTRALEQAVAVYREALAQREERMPRPAFFSEPAEWKGPAQQPPKGKRIAVYAEQGLGDVIQFIRYVPLMRADGAAVFGVIPPDLIPLLEHSMPGLQCLTPQRQFEVDHHVALLDLPMHYGTTLESVPAAAPYLHPPQDKVDLWRGRLAPWSKKLKVGIAWAGSPQQVNNINRSMRLSQLAPLVEMADVQCFSLQKGDAGPFTDVAFGAEQLVDLTSEWADFTDSAAMLQNLDLIITVDTAVAHLAGAMGKPVWVMLAPNADWRWLLAREDSPWYPTMRLFGRGFGEAREAQVERVIAALREQVPERR